MLHPEDYGAVGNGVADDTAAVQRTLDAAARQDARVELRAGATYLCSRSVQLPSGAYLFGHGTSSVLRFTWTQNTASGDGYYLGNAEQTSGDHDITLDDFAIRGAGSGLPSGPNAIASAPWVPGIRLRLVHRFAITRLDVSHVAGISVLYQGSDEGLLANNHVHDSGRDGITGTWHLRNMTHVLVRDNLIERIGDDGVALVGAPGQTANTRAQPHDLVVQHNRIRGWDRNPNGLQIGRGIALLSVRRTWVTGNTVQRTHSYGILLAGSTRAFSTDPRTGRPWRSGDVLVEGNRILGAGANRSGSRVTGADGGADAIRVKDSVHVVVRRNLIVRPAAGRVVVSDCQGCSW